MDLFADPQPGAHQRHADFRAAEPHHLDIGRERRGPGEIGIGQRDQDDGQQRERLADRLQQHDRNEIARRPIMGQLRSEQIRGGERRQSDHQHATRVEMPEQEYRHRHHHEHRQRAIDHQQRAGLFGAEETDRAKKIRHQRRIGQAAKRVEKDDHQREPDIAREQHADMRPRLANQGLVDEKAGAEHAAADQQSHDRAGFQPVQPVALIKAGIDHGDAGTEQQHAAPVGLLQQGPVDRLMRCAEIDQQPHQGGEDDALPVQPLPAQVVDIETDQRGAGVEREPDPDRIDRNRRQPPFDRQIAKNDHQGGGNEGAEQHAVDNAERDQRVVVTDERNHQRDRGIDQARNSQHAAQPERGCEPGHRRGDENLRAYSRGGEPGAFVEAQRKGATQVRQSDRGQPAVEIRQKGAEQHGTDGEHRLRRNAATRDRPAVVRLIFRHPSPPGRYEFGSPPTCQATAAPAASGPGRFQS